MMNGITECCKDCKERHPACHSHCEKYLSARKEYDKRKEMIAAELYSPLYTYKVAKIRKEKIRRSKHGK